MKYYIDTCIWIDYWENRSDNLRPIGEFAFKFLSNIEEEDEIIYTKLTLTELRKFYSEETILSILSIIKKQLTFIEYTEDDFNVVKTLISTGLLHKTDALHITVARRKDALFITRDKQILLSGLIKSYMPEDLI